MFTSTLNVLDKTHLDHSLTASTVVEQARTRVPEDGEKVPKEEEVTGLRRLEQEIATAAGLVRPLDAMVMPAVEQPGPVLEELLREIENLRSPDTERIIDRFE